MPRRYDIGSLSLSNPIAGLKSEWFHVYEYFVNAGVPTSRMAADGKEFSTREEAEAWIAESSAD